MSNQISLQADVGSLGLNGLGAFSHVLAVLSTDNISPMALIQMEQLGSAFHINGQYAAKVSECLTRVSSHPLGRLALSVGWRKGDSASLLAQSAGGQAISLLSVCLVNLYTPAATGEILAMLCGKLLPRQHAVASVAQLAGAADLLAAKLDRLGFGNLLAQQAVRVQSVYETLGMQSPRDLFETPSTESIAGVFECLKHLTEEGSIVRIRGTYAIVHILAIVLFMFPHDAVVTVESLVIHDGPSRRVMVEIHTGEIAQACVEKELGQPPYLNLPIKSPEAHENIKRDCSFQWQGWLARKLELEFAKHGTMCTQAVLVSCCNIILAFAPLYRSSFVLNNEVNMRRTGIWALLGAYPQSQIEQACQAVFGTIPEHSGIGAEQAWEQFTTTLTEPLGRVDCNCLKCDIRKGWLTKRGSNLQRSCRRFQLWEIVGRALTAGLLSLPVNARPFVAVPGCLPRLHHVANIISRILTGDDMFSCFAGNFLEDALDLFSAYSAPTILSIGASSRASTIFPTVLETLEVHQDNLFSLELIDGVFVWQDRYFHCLSDNTGSRQKATSSLLTGRTPIVPSNLGAHSTITTTIREGHDELLLQVVARTLGSQVHVNMKSVVIAYLGIERTEECEHRLDYPLSDNHDRKILVTGVGMPRAAGRKLALAMARSNPTAQLLCCEESSKCILLQGCCLDCGVKQAGKDFDILIVS
ncbi:hypothetical protein QBC42DRAFT_310595 [Cladorrhinum samala]|uniref:Uncharacterized protein n=1 Tax=Cladorrhinum samala TaxID=585594 RepID=A0AAV9I0X3_9PEZI|nr:hypothetical protein QBC42DRAFT_310595 [Cladorrhinum samala]